MVIVEINKQSDLGWDMDFLNPAIVAIAKFDTYTRFQAMAARGNPEEGLKLLDKLDS